MALLMATYPITRFLIEGLWGDEGVFLAGLTMSQGMSVVVFGGGPHAPGPTSRDFRSDAMRDTAAPLPCGGTPRKGATV